jgi:hypothetical protein
MCDSADCVSPQLRQIARALSASRPLPQFLHATDISFGRPAARLRGAEQIPGGASFNQSVARTDKLQKPRFLRLTGVARKMALAEMAAGGDKMET